MQTDDHQPVECMGEYNRKTTDYGNGIIEITTYHKPKQKYTMDTTARVLLSSNSVLSDKEQERRTKKQLYAIRRQIKGYALANDFKWFVTLTYNPQKINSSDYQVAKSTLSKWCRWMRDKYKKFDYLLVPELHKSGAVHFHGLLGDIPANFVEAVNPKTGNPVIRSERQVYNLADWKYGFSDCEKIESPQKAASYITKYITTALLTDKEMYKKKRYFNSQELKKPNITYGMEYNAVLGHLTPNFGVVSTDDTGRNILDVGIYKFTKNENGALVQEDTDYLIIAKS